MIYLHPTETITCRFVDALRQPDGAVGLTKTGPLKGDNIYKTTAVKGQTIKRTGLAVGQDVRLLGARPERQRRRATPSSSRPRRPALRRSAPRFIFGDDITPDVMAGTYEAPLDAQGQQMIRVRVTIGAGTPKASPFKIVLTLSSHSYPSQVDVVRLVATR